MKTLLSYNMTNIRTLTLLAVLISCQSPAPNYSSTEIATTVTSGNWQSGEMFIKYNSYRSGDKDSTLLLNQFNYEQIMGTSRQSISFKSNGDYLATSIRFPKGDTVKSVGTWQTNHDALSIAYGTTLTKYKVHTLSADSIKLQGIIDLDADGEVDDEVELIIIKSSF